MVRASNGASISVFDGSVRGLFFLSISLLIAIFIFSGIAQAGPKVYWSDFFFNSIKASNADGSSDETVISGLTTPRDIAIDDTGGKIYWVDSATVKLQRANLDGSNIEDLLTSGVAGIRGLVVDEVSSKLYWTDRNTKKIQRANLDGTNIEDLVTTGLSEPFSIDLDLTNNKIYWSDFSTQKIQRSNLDGSSVEDILTGLTEPAGLALDVAGNKLYWVDGAGDKIQRANLDGSSAEDLVTGVNLPQGIAVDADNSKMYWTAFLDRKIQRADLDGSNVEDIVTTGVSGPAGIDLCFLCEVIPVTFRENQIVNELVIISDNRRVASTFSPSSVYGDFTSSNGEIVGIGGVDALRLTKTGEVFTNLLTILVEGEPTISIGVGMVMDFTVGGSNALETALNSAGSIEGIRDIMKFYLQIDGGGFNEFIPTVDYRFDFDGDKFIIWTIPTGQLSAAGINTTYDYQLDILDWETRFSAVGPDGITNVVTDLRGDHVIGHPSAVPEIPAGAAIPLLALLGVGMLIIRKRFKSN